MITQGVSVKAKCVNEYMLSEYENSYENGIIPVFYRWVWFPLGHHLLDKNGFLTYYVSRGSNYFPSNKECRK
jgi:hypothetical protein